MSGNLWPRCLLVAAVALGCSDTAGLDRVPVSVTLQEATTGSPAAYGGSITIAGAPGGVSADDVDSLMVTFTRVEFLPQGAGEDDEGGWQSVDVTGNGRLNLMQLPTEADAGVVIAADELSPGDYGHVRFFVEELVIWFNRPISLGQGNTFDPDTPYDVTLPSGAQTGLKTDAGFTVPEGGGEIAIVFDPTATIGNIAVTGDGGVMLAPVLRKRGS